MEGINQIKARLNEQKITNAELEILEKKATIWKGISEFEKVQMERSKLNKNENKIIPLLSIILPAFLTAMTLIITVYQFNLNSEMQRKSEKDNNWREFLKQLSNSEQMNNNLTIPATLVSYLRSEDYATESRNIALTLLPNFTDEDMFSLLYNGIYETTQWNNFDDLVTIAKRLSKSYKKIGDDMLKEKEMINNPKNVHLLLTLNERYSRDSSLHLEIDKELSIVSKSIIQFIKNRERPKGYILQLNKVSFYKDDLSGLNLSGAELSFTELNSCNVENTDFSHVINFESSSWTGTQWWKSKDISQSLKQYLIKNYPYNPETSYTGVLDTTNYNSLKN